MHVYPVKVHVYFFHIHNRKNEEIDDKSMIRRLRKRIADLETQLADLKNSDVRQLEKNGKVWKLWMSILCDVSVTIRFW